MKAIVLTYAPVEASEQELLKNTTIYKIALNQHAEEFCPDIRIVTDYILEDICKKFPEKIVSVRDTLRCDSKRVEYFDIEFKGSTILAAIEYLISKNYKEILIIGDNRVNHPEFREQVNKDIENLKDSANIYQYTTGNFNLPVKTITEFCHA